MGNRSSNPKPAPIPQPRNSVPKELPKPVIYQASSSYHANRRATYETDSDSDELPKPVTYRSFSSYHANRRATYETDSDELPKPVIYRTPSSYHDANTISETHEAWHDRIQRNFALLRINNDQDITNCLSEESRRVRPPMKVTIDLTKFDVQFDPYFVTNRVVSYIPLSEYDSEYIQIKGIITNKRRFKVDGIEKIENPFLKKAYALKKEEKVKEFGHVEERLLFHGTPQSNVESICKYNFDWRLCKAHKFGKGVSFSPNANYASNYSDKTYNKVMIVAKVMIARSCIGNAFMELPPPGCDTSQKGADGIVIVKYEDNEFCPLYKINYHLATEDVKPHSNRGHRVRRTSNFEDLLFDDDDYLYSY